MIGTILIWRYAAKKERGIRHAWKGTTGSLWKQFKPEKVYFLRFHFQRPHILLTSKFNMTQHHENWELRQYHVIKSTSCFLVCYPPQRLTPCLPTVCLSLMSGLYWRSVFSYVIISLFFIFISFHWFSVCLLLRSNIHGGNHKVRLNLSPGWTQPNKVRVIHITTSDICLASAKKAYCCPFTQDIASILIIPHRPTKAYRTDFIRRHTYPLFLYHHIII